MKNNKKVVLICMLLITSIFTIASSSVVADENIIYVDDDASPEWYDETHVRTIQEGIDIASDSDTIFVYSGTYYGLIIINKTLRLTGEEKASTIIDGLQLGEDTITVTAPSFHISGFTIRNSPRGSGYNSGLKLENSDDSVIEYNIFTDNCWAAEIRSSSNCIFSDNIVIDNEQGGVHLAMSPSTQVTGCTFSGNGKKGLAIFKGNDHLISSNTFIDCGIEINSQPPPGDTVHCIMKDNTVNGKPLVYLENENGKIIWDAGQVILNQCTGIVIRNLDLSDTSTGIRVYKSGFISILGNTLTNNFHGISVVNSLFVNIRNNKINRNWYNGVGFSGNILCRLSFNEITENYIGLYLHESTLTMPYLNRIHSNWNCNFFVSPLFMPWSFQIF
jgi:parallel beta-helix repeat protein